MRIQYSPLGTFLYWISDLFMKMGKQIRNLPWWLNCYAYDLFPKWYFAVLYTQHLQLNCHHVLYINIQHKHLYTKETSKNPTRILEGHWACHVTKDSESGSLIGRPASSWWKELFSWYVTWQALYPVRILTQILGK